MTILYVDISGAFAPTPSFTPTPFAAWDRTTAVSVYGLKPSGFGTTAYTNLTDDNGATAAQICRVMAVTAPLQSTHLWSNAVNCNFNIKAAEAVATQDAFTLWSFGVISNDGSTLLFSTSLMKDNSEVPLTTPASRNNNAGYTVSPVSYTNVPGDRFYVELGWDKDGAIAGNLTLTFGYNSANANLSTTDGNTLSTNPFVNIVTHTFTFDPEGTVYGGGGGSTGFNGLMMMGNGT